jgi:hypothetical protein
MHTCVQTSCYQVIKVDPGISFRCVLMMLDPVRYYPHIADEVLWFIRSLVRWLVRCEGLLTAPPSL